MSDKKRSNHVSSSKAKTLRSDKSTNHIDMQDEESSTKKDCDPKKLLSLSQPILTNDLKKKLHVFLANWKPPLKTVASDVKENIDNTVNPRVMHSSISMENKEDTESITKTSPNISPCTLQENLPPQKKDSEDIQEINFTTNNDDLTTETTDEMVLISQSDNNLPEKSMTHTSEHSLQADKCDNSNLIKPTKHELENDDKTIQQELQDSKSNEELLNHIVHADGQETSNIYLTPEQKTTTPSTPPTIKLIWPVENVFPLHKPENIQSNANCIESPGKSSEISSKGNVEPNFHETEVNLIASAVNDTSTMNSEQKMELKHPSANNDDIAGELEKDMNISNSQLESIENNILSVEPPQKKSKTVTFSDTPSPSVPFAPQMPQMKWVRQLQEDKRRLQNVVREVSHVNAMLTRAIREIWSTNKTS